MRGNAHVRFGGRAGETDLPRGRHRAPVRPYTFGWLNLWRRLGKDYEVLTATSEAFIRLAMIGIMLRRLAHQA